MKRSVGKPRIKPNELTKPVSTAMGPSLLEAMTKQAEKDGRTLSRQISYACERLVGARELQESIGIS